MSPKRPYLVRALYDWLLDNQLTPHVVVDATWPGAEVPQEFVQDGQIVLNIHPEATLGFEMGSLDITFQARFGGVPRRVTIPYGAMLAIYAKENGAGSIFEPEPAYDDPEAALIPDERPLGKPVIVKDSTDEEKSSDDDDEPPQPPRGRPHLKVIK